MEFLWGNKHVKFSIPWDSMDSTWNTLRNFHDKRTKTGKFHRDSMEFTYLFPMEIPWRERYSAGSPNQDIDIKQVR